MQKIIARAEEQFHAIDGVIHCAGLPDGEMIQRRTKEKSAQIFKPKIQGTLVLDGLLHLMKKKPGFFLLCSSVASILPLLGQAGYSAANAFLDAFAHYRNTPGSDSNPMLTVSVNWDRWRSIGIANILETQHKELTGRDLAGGITSSEGVETFRRILANTQPQVVVSPHDIGILFEKAYSVKAPSLIKGLEETVVPGKALPRPQLDSQYTPPRNKTEETLANLWAGFFGYEKIGTRDDFFELGGDSLKALIILPNIHKKLNVEIPIAEFFNRPTIEVLVEYIEHITEKTAYVSIETAEKKEYYSLASAQKRLYILQQLDLTNISYNQSNVVILEGELEKDRLERTFRKLLERHECLRTSFEIINGEPVQRVHAEVDFETEYFCAERKAQSAKRQEGRHAPCALSCASTIKDFIRPFDLAQAPLLRVGLIKLPAEQPTSHILLVDMHHIIADGISMGILKEDFMSLYGTGELPALRIRYIDFSEWQNLRKEKEAAKSSEAFWLKEFEGEIPVLNLPTDYARPEIQEFKGNATTFEINKEQLKAIKALARAREATLYMLLLSIYTILLAKLGGQEDIVVGTPTAGRRHPELQPVIGMFANTMALRNYPVGEKTCRKFFAEVKERTLNALENQDYPFEDLVEQAAVRRDFSRNPIFDVMFILQNMETKEPEIPGLKLKPYEYEYNVAKFDLTLTGVETGTGLLFTFEYSTSLFKQATIGRFIRYFKIILAEVLENSEIKLGEIEIIPAEEKKELLYDFNNTDTDYPENKTVHQLFAQQVERTPGYIALVGVHETHEKHEKNYNMSHLSHMSYKELNEKSRQLACFLIEKGVKPGTIVGILLERTPQMLIGLLGILKAGAAYLPLDPEYPRERIKYIIEKSSITLLLTRESIIRKYQEALFAGEIIDISARDLYREPGGEVGGRPTYPAYVIYTSGSTGNPKGVIVCHKNAVNFITGMASVIDFSPGKTILALTTISFDIFLLETLLPVTCGLKVVIAAEGEQKDPQLLKDVIRSHQVEMIQATPSRLKLLLGLQDDLRCLTGVKELMVGGEAFPPPLFENVKTHFQGKIYNLYGPTETTVWSTIKELSHSQSHEITIGSPIANTQIYIVGTDMRVQPLGVAGELLIGGDGVAMGYLDSVELTAERFINYKPNGINTSLQSCNHASMQYHSQSPHYPTYKTGDLARWLIKGEIEFLGRMDYQVKIRGIRIEPREIEDLLATNQHIKEVAVVDRPDPAGEKHLCAYIVLRVADATPPDITEMREHLSGHLPQYMIPSYFIFLEKIPLTPNGKVNRRALPGYNGYRPGLRATYVAPTNETEQKVADIWREVLLLDKVGINDNFFELGGNSMKVLHLNSRLKQELGKDIPIAVMFRFVTIRSFMDYLARQGNGKRVEREKQRQDKLNKAIKKYKTSINKFKNYIEKGAKDAP
jgi:amino acid adenylation domain-containing protein